MNRSWKKTSISVAVLVCTGCLRSEADVSPVEQIRLAVSQSAEPGEFVTVFTTLVELPKTQDPFTILGLRKYYDRMVANEPFYTPKGSFVRDTYSHFLHDIVEGEYKLSRQERRDLDQSLRFLYQTPSTIDLLKGQSDLRLKPRIERHLSETSIVNDDLLLRRKGFDKGLVFIGFSELISDEPAVRSAFSTLRVISGLQLKMRKENLITQFTAFDGTPVFKPLVSDWLRPTGWREIKIFANGARAICLIDVRLVDIIRPWFADEIFTDKWFEINESGDLWTSYRKLPEPKKSFFEEIFGGIPVSLILAGNKRLVGEWTPESLNTLPLVIQNLHSDPLIIGVVARNSPQGPFPDLTQFKFVSHK